MRQRDFASLQESRLMVGNDSNKTRHIVHTRSLRIAPTKFAGARWPFGIVIPAQAASKQLHLDECYAGQVCG
jgi:hypothetical protein